MSFFPWSKKDKKSKEKKGGSVAASSSVVASSPASASSNEISKFFLNFTSCLFNQNSKRNYWRMFEEFRSHVTYLSREVGEFTKSVNLLLQSEKSDSCRILQQLGQPKNAVLQSKPRYFVGIRNSHRKFSNFRSNNQQLNSAKVFKDS